MHTKGPKEDPLVDLGYESRDINYRLLRNALIGFFTFTFAMSFVGWFIFKAMNPVFADGFKPNEIGKVPGSPVPLLQDNIANVTDIMSVRKAETARLSSTGWADDSHKFAHIPIDRAIDLLVQKGLPDVGADTPAVSKGNTTDEKKYSSPEMAPPASESSKPSAAGSSKLPTSPAKH